jgi:hypothetical protein
VKELGCEIIRMDGLNEEQAGLGKDEREGQKKRQHKSTAAGDGEGTQVKGIPKKIIMRTMTGTRGDNKGTVVSTDTGIGNMTNQVS